MSHLANAPQHKYARNDHDSSSRASTSSNSGSRRPYDSARRERSPRAFSRYDDRSDDNEMNKPRKTRKLDGDERSASGNHDRSWHDSSLSPRKIHGSLAQNSSSAPVSIRGSADSRSSDRLQAQDSDRRKSPDLLHRLRGTDSQGTQHDRYSERNRDQRYTNRPRSDYDNVSPRETFRQGGPSKLAPRGRYDDNGRRIDESDATKVTSESNAATRPVSKSEDVASSRHSFASHESASTLHDKSASHASYSTSRQSRDDSRYFRHQRRSPSPDAPASDRYSRNRSPNQSSSYRKADEPYNKAVIEPRSRQWGASTKPRDRYSEYDDMSKGRSERTIRQRSPSPTRSDHAKHKQIRSNDRSSGRDSGPRTADDRHRRDEASTHNPARRQDRARKWKESVAAANKDSPDRNDDRLGKHEGRHALHPPDSHSGPTLAKTGENPADQYIRDKSETSASLKGCGWQRLSPKDISSQQRRDRDHDLRALEPDTSKTTGVVIRADPGEGYVSINQVGEGTYGQVFKACSEQTGVLVALKKIRMESEKEGFPITAMREIRLLQALRHENVVRLHEMMVTRGSIYMVFEYMEHDLNGILAHQQIHFSDAHRKSLALQLLTGLEYLHKKAVLHRDLKGSNILLNNEGRLKLADFGLARFYAKRRIGDYTNRVVTLWYRPPELLFGETQYGVEVDVWGAGCLFLELFVRKPVFQGESEIQQVQVIANILGPITPAAWPGLERLAWFEMVKPETKSLEDGSSSAATPAEHRNKDYVTAAFGHCMPESALQVVKGLLTYDPRRRSSSTEALQATYFTEAPRPELPARILSALDGEWHEYESRRARKKGHNQTTTAARASDRLASATTDLTDNS